MEKIGKTNILFVDEEQSIHKALRRSFRKKNHEWTLWHAGNPQEALGILSKETIDVVVTETLFTRMNGLNFLAEIKEKFPKIVRIILSGYSDRDVILKSIETAHQYLSKPCDDETLKSTINKAFKMKALLENESLKSVVSGIDSLPSLPDLYVEIMEEVKSEDASIKKVGEIISKDLGMTTKILQLVNSSFFGVTQNITSLEKAVSMLGLDLIKAVVLTAGVFSTFDRLEFDGFSIEDLWSHGLNTGTFSKEIGRTEKLEKRTIDDSFMAGLLHDVGKMIIASNLRDNFIEILKVHNENGLSFSEAEFQVMGATHAEIGAYLLGLWGLPETIIEAVAFHHLPQNNSESMVTPLTIVHVANALENAGERIHSDAPIDGIDYEYLGRLNMTDRLASWQQDCRKYLGFRPKG